MHKHPFLTFLIGLIFVGLGQSTAQAGTKPVAAKLGQKIPNLTLTDAQGKKHALHDLKGRNAIVLVFVSFECPVSNSYMPTLIDMQSELKEAGVTFWGLTVNLDETPKDNAKHVKDFNLNFPVFRDDAFRVAEAVDARVTPEVFVLDADFVLRYRGRIDDSYQARLKKHAKAQRHDLDQALVEVLTGRKVAVPATEAIGCHFAREVKRPATVGTVTYYKHVAPIMQKDCQQCHRPGEVGPFSLMTYKQAVNWAEDIKTFTQNRTMPPWKPSAGGPFHNPRTLSDKDIATLAAWVDGGTPEGEAKDGPAPRDFPQGWQLGKPDLVLTPSDEFTLGPDGRDVFRCFVMPTNLPEDVYVSAVELRPGNPRVVHHVLLFLDTTGQGRKLEQAQKAKTGDDLKIEGHDRGTKFDVGPGYNVAMGVGFAAQGQLNGWAPGQMPRHLPEGIGFFVPKGSDVIMQVHYHRNGRVEKDKTQIGIYFRKTKVEHPLQGGALAGQGLSVGPAAMRLFFTIPAGDENFKLKGDFYAKDDFTMLAVTPHMHMLGKEIAVTMTPPGGKGKTLVAIKDWDYNWQESYLFKQPIQVKKGTHFHLEAVFDNSSKNPRNPSSPPRRVTFGEQTTNEMCFVFMNGYSETKGRRLPLSAETPKDK